MNNDELEEHRMPVLERTADERIKELENDLGNTERCEQAQIQRADKAEQKVRELEEERDSITGGAYQKALQDNTLLQACQRVEQMQELLDIRSARTLELTKRIKELEAEISDYLVCNGCGYRNAHDKYGLVPSRSELQNIIKYLKAQKKVIYCEAIALLTQVNGNPMEVAVAHDYIKKLYEGE